MDQIVNQLDGFDFEIDDRYHCKYCGFNTQLRNKAMSHLQKKHGDQLVAAEDQSQEPELDQENDPGVDMGWVPESADKKLDEEEQ